MVSLVDDDGWLEERWIVVLLVLEFSEPNALSVLDELVDDDGWLEERWIVVLLVLEFSEPNALSVLDELVDKNIPDEDDTNERTLDGDTGSKTALPVTLDTEESVDETSRCASDDPADTAGADFTDESLDEIPSDSPTDLGNGTIDELLSLLYAIDELFKSFDPIEPLESIGPIELTWLIESSKSIELIESTELTKSSASTELTKLAGPTASSGPIDWTETCDPTTRSTGLLTRSTRRPARSIRLPTESPVKWGDRKTERTRAERATLFCLVRERSFKSFNLLLLLVGLKEFNNDVPDTTVTEEPVEPDGSTGSTTVLIVERRDLANLVGIGETSVDDDKASTDGDLDVANNWSTVETNASEVSVVSVVPDVAPAVLTDFHESAICPPETNVEVVREPS